MRFQELKENAAKSLPGATSGMKIMSVAQFAGQDDSAEEQEVDESFPYDVDHMNGRIMRNGEGMSKTCPHCNGNRYVWTNSEKGKTPKHPWINPNTATLKSKEIPCPSCDGGRKKVAESKMVKDPSGYMRNTHTGRLESNPNDVSHSDPDYYRKLRVARREKNAEYKRNSKLRKAAAAPVDEATKLPAQQRELKGKELTDYFDRIRGTAKLDKQGNKTFGKDKVSKKGVVTPGAEKYDSGKTKGDRYKMPYIHRSSVIDYYSEAGKKYDVDAIKSAVAQRPGALLKQNEKMKHSNGEFEQFFNIGFAALTGLALDENTGELIIVNTCPGAGACKVDCFAMKGGKIQFAGPWLSDARILTYLLNDPDGFKSQLMNEIKAEYDEGVAGDKKFPKGWAVTVRWHDAGDFFSPAYMDLAFDIARAFPGVKFYAYTKMAAAALGNKPDNFIVNWSEGAHTSQEKQVKAQDPELKQTKNSRIVPVNIFYDLLKKDAKGNLVKTPGGAWQPADAAALKELKQRIADAYKLSAHSILSYDEWMAKNHGNGMKWNVIVAPGEGDVSANSHDVLSTLLLRH